MESQPRTPTPVQEGRRCFLCGRSQDEIGAHPLPILQKAHVLANRLTGGEKRYGGVKNPLTDAEWDILLRRIGVELHTDSEKGDGQRKRAMSLFYWLCGECHEEVLSEPVYLPCVMDSLSRRFKGMTRVERILLLARVLKLGTAALDREMALPAQ